MNTILEIEQKWVLVEGESKGHPYFMMVNDGLKSFKCKNDYSQCIIAVVDLREVQGHKLPTDEEAVVLNSIEELIIGKLKPLFEPILVGRETYYGEREILIYVKEMTEYKQVIDSISKEINKLRCVHLKFYNDPEWKEATRYLGPIENT